MFQLTLKSLREQNNISQATLARALNIAQSTVGMWESGKNKPTFAMLIQIADFFHVSVDYLISYPTTQADRKSQNGADMQEVIAADNGLSPFILPGDHLTIQKGKDAEGGDVVLCKQHGKQLLRKVKLTDDGLILVGNADTDPSIWTKTGGTKIVGVVKEIHRML